MSSKARFQCANSMYMEQYLSAELVEEATNPIELDETYVMELLATTLPENYNLVSK